GMIPEFSDPAENGAKTDLLDSFHLLRVILDARSQPGCLVAGVTSPVSGDGKTTVSLLLARSFAMTRRRVLLIDADLVGRGLTRMLNIEPRERASDHGAKLGDLVVAIEGGRIDLLPASNAETASDSFCRHVLQELLKTARQEYDVVLLDTGPILGSIEAAAMVPVVDQMLLIVSRGLESRMLRMSTNRLRELQASSVGIVFNRASTVDFHRSYSPVSSASRRNSNRTFGTVLPPMVQDEPARSGREGAHG
ncbi:MAG: CpsD/CapB family tyrosine-protein kinase, partial [Phycisphaerales bacterium]|nr:CpsD/CapB family tyrosine-protein kinase [Phycisphaerales bacterium]